MKLNTEDTLMHQFAVLWITNAFALGITLPVINLMLLQKNASLSSLALIMGLFSAVVVITEVPSGIIADRFGRRFTFLLSKGFIMAGSMLLVLGSCTVTLIISVVFLGLARSFASGSFEALTVDWYIGRKGVESLHQITTRISVWETIGLSLGSLSAGFIVVWFEPMGFTANRYAGNFILSTILQFVVIVLTLIWIKQADENYCHDASREKSRGMFADIRGNRLLLSLLLAAFALGFLLSSVEKYWQPRLIAVTDSEEIASILLGVVAFIGFAGALGGAVAAGKIFDRHTGRIRMMFLLLRIVMALTLVGLATSTSSFSYITWYGGTYLLLGMSSVAEQTLLNRVISSQRRASLLSVSSFFLQIGGLVSSLFAALWLRMTSDGIDSLWIISSLLLVLLLIPLMTIGREEKYFQ